MKRCAPWTITFADLLTQCLCFMVIWPAIPAAERPKAPAAEPAPAEAGVPALPPFGIPPPAESDAGTVRIPLPRLFEPGAATLVAGFETSIEEAARVASYDPTGRAATLVTAEASGLELALARADAAAAALARAGSLPRERFAVAGRLGGGDGAVLVLSFSDSETDGKEGSGGAPRNAERESGAAEDVAGRQESPPGRIERE